MSLWKIPLSVSNSAGKISPEALAVENVLRSTGIFLLKTSLTVASNDKVFAFIATQKKTLEKHHHLPDCAVSDIWCWSIWKDKTLLTKELSHWENETLTRRKVRKHETLSKLANLLKTFFYFFLVELRKGNFYVLEIVVASWTTEEKFFFLLISRDSLSTTKVFSRHSLGISHRLKNTCLTLKKRELLNKPSAEGCCKSLKQTKKLIADTWSAFKSELDKNSLWKYINLWITFWSKSLSCRDDEKNFLKNQLQNKLFWRKSWSWLETNNFVPFPTFSIIERLIVITETVIGMAEQENQLTGVEKQYSLNRSRVELYMVS